MRFSFKLVLAGMATLSAFLLALTHVGPTPVMPGFNTRFHTVDPCPDGSLCFGTEAGDLTTLVTLWVRAPSGASGWTARLNDGTSLAVRAEPWGARGAMLVIVRPDTQSTRAKFASGSGVTLEVSNHARVPFQLHDWRVDVSEKEGPDTRIRARWRAIWFAVSLVALAIGAVGAVSAQLGKEGQTRDIHTLGRELVAATVEELEPEEGEDIAAIRGVLGDVLLRRSSADNAVKKWAPGKSRSRQLQLLVTARKKFSKRWSEVLSTLQEYLEHLGGADGKG